MKMKWTKEVYEKIESQLHHDKLKTFCFSAEEYQMINWIDEKEFVLDYRWYDVIDKVKLEDGSHLLNVFCDDGEKEWIAQFFKSKQDSNSNQSKQFLQNSFKFSLFQDLIIVLKDLPKCKDQFFDLTLLLSFDYYTVQYPPPRLV